MARPWQEHVEAFDVVQQFRELGVGLIINLQEVGGRRPGCSAGWLRACGFCLCAE